MEELQITCFGEVLWDVFPNHRKIGGAPLNVAVRLKSLANKVSMVSRVGQDELGALLLDGIDEKGVNIKNIQIDSKLKTGTVKVLLNNKGSASYDIVFPRAWDNIEVTDSNKLLIESSDAFIFGSLVGRSEISENSLLALLELATFKVFDVNLRIPYYTKELLIEFMNQADFIKFNDEELLEISQYLGSEYNSIQQNIRYVSEKTDTHQICVTKGENGAVLFYDDHFYHNNGYSVAVKDTVGAGDSFLAALINFLLKNKHPQNAIDIACAFGAMVAQSEGANPEINIKDVEKLINTSLR